MGGIIAAVRAGSIAEELGLRPGDELLSINGHSLRDVIDYRFYSAEENLEILVQRDGQKHTYRLAREYSQELGLDFASPTFDGIRRCNNRCRFCFVDQLPQGMRRSLYIKDDDYRYSFLFGNFITLTNLDEEDWERLAEQRLSPLYVSVHATDPKLRGEMFGHPGLPDIVKQLKRLGRLGISVQAQIVLCPGLNDGEHLVKTVADLAVLYPTVQSIAIVPIGLTRYHRSGFRPCTPAEAKGIVAQVRAWQSEYRGRHGLNLVYASDEWYFLAGEEIPQAEEYDGFPQVENGVGLTRVFLDEWEREKRELGERRELRGANVTMVCGTLIAPVLAGVAAELSRLTGATIEVVPVVNELFGPTVTVSGLLTAGDVIEALRGRDLGDLVLLPRAMFNPSGQLTLDDLTLAEMERRLGVRVEMAGSIGEAVSKIQKEVTLCPD